MDDLYYDGDWREALGGTTRPVTLDTYEGPEDGSDQDEPQDPRDEYDRDNASGYDARNWSF